jgi:hypothetical protein
MIKIDRRQDQIIFTGIASGNLVKGSNLPLKFKFSSYKMVNFKLIDFDELDCLHSK